MCQLGFAEKISVWEILNLFGSNCHRQACIMHNFSEEDAYSFKKTRMLCQKVHPGWSLVAVMVKVGYILKDAEGVWSATVQEWQWQVLSTSLATQLLCDCTRRLESNKRALSSWPRVLGTQCYLSNRYYLWKWNQQLVITHRVFFTF